MSALRVPWSQRPKTARIAKPGFIDPALRETVRKRAGGRCECCGDVLFRGWECHHRKLRSRGGQDSATNLVALCSYCHRRLHNHVKFATDNGFVVSAYDDPASVALLLNLSEAVYLTPDGTYRYEGAKA